MRQVNAAKGGIGIAENIKKPTEEFAQLIEALVLISVVSEKLAKQVIKLSETGKEGKQ